MKDLKFLRDQVEIHFESNGYAESCRKRYRNTWDNLMMFMRENGHKLYTPEIGYSFLTTYHDGKGYDELSDRQKERYRHVDVLSNLILEGKIRRCVRHNKVYLFSGEVGKVFSEFISECRITRSAGTIRRYEERIYVLYQFLVDNGFGLSDFSVPRAMQFIRMLDNEMPEYHRDNTVMTIRVFLRYLCGRGLLCDNSIERWMKLFALKKVTHKKIPSVYTAEEVEKVLNAIDRSHPQGKRDYAMTLLAARYGLRVCDIIGLRFCNLVWEEDMMVLVQQKTGKKVSLPLSEEVGAAIITYIREARPSIDLPYVFITCTAPYRPLGSNILASNISDWMRSAGIDSTGRKRGPHALRHSLATNLLNLNNPMPVISEILGHSSTQSTTTYTRVSLDMLRKCALDVPFVPSSFYENIYG